MSLYHKETIFDRDEIQALVDIYFSKRTGHIETIDNLAFLPTLLFPIVEIPKTSPLVYPLPEDVTVQAPTTPSTI